MEEKQKMRNAVLSKTNILITIGAFCFFVINCSLAIFQEGNLAAPTLTDKLILFFIILLIVAPLFSVLALLLSLRVKHLIKTKDLLEFISPQKGSLGNPDIKEVLGERGFKIARKMLYALISLILVSLLTLIIALNL